MSVKMTFKPVIMEEGDPSQMQKDVIIKGVVSVTVLSAEELPSGMDLMGKPNPFVEITLKKSGQKSKTRVVNDSLNPVWNQTFHFVVEDALHELIIFQVYDHDVFGKEKMGRCGMTWTGAMIEGEFTDSFSLDREGGKLILHLKWTSQTVIRHSLFC